MVNSSTCKAIPAAGSTAALIYSSSLLVAPHG